MMKTIAVSLLGACFLALAAPAQSQEAAKAEPKAAQARVSMCIGCHGIPLYKTVYPEVYNVPKIAGQSTQYITNALRSYRSGDRSHPSMTGIAKGLSDADIASLAAYYGGTAGGGK